MKRRRCVAVLCAALGWSPPAGARPIVEVDVGTSVTVPDVRPIGINLGTWHTWGAEQLGRNVLQNPGFEGIIDRALVYVAAVDKRRIADDQKWLGRAGGFWRGARYEVLSGASAGTRGVVEESWRSDLQGLPTYLLQGDAPVLATGDVLALTRVEDAGLPERWHASGNVGVERGYAVPGVGERVLALCGGGAVVQYLDAIGDRAGKMLSLSGWWKLRLRHRLVRGEARLHVRVQRQGSPAVVDELFAPLELWGESSIDIRTDDDGPPGTIAVTLAAEGDGEVHIDDVELFADDGRAGEIRSVVVDGLRELHPGYLRDWQGGQGATLENRLAEPHARRLTRSSARAEETVFELGWPAILDLCDAIGGSPWLVVPTTFTIDEWRGLGAWLAHAAPPSRFREVLIEFGNENWNPLSRNAGIIDPERHGQAAERAFQALREASADAPIRTVVNGQFAQPRAALSFAHRAPTANLLAVAPYFLFAPRSGLSLEQRVGALFPDDRDKLRALESTSPPELAVYELNVHATGGDATANEREQMTVSAAAASAVVDRVMTMQQAGARRIALYTLASFDTWLEDRSGFAPLWGVARDLSDGIHWRPTGLALQLMNRAIAGDRIAVRVDDPDIGAAAFRTPAGVSMVVWSRSLEARSLRLTWPTPEERQRPREVWALRTESPWRTNERGSEVSIEKVSSLSGASSARVTVAPLGLVVIAPERSGLAQP